MTGMTRASPGAKKENAPSAVPDFQKKVDHAIDHSGVEMRCEGGNFGEIRAGVVDEGHGSIRKRICEGWAGFACD